MVGYLPKKLIIIIFYESQKRTTSFNGCSPFLLSQSDKSSSLATSK